MTPPCRRRGVLCPAPASWSPASWLKPGMILALCLPAGALASLTSPPHLRPQMPFTQGMPASPLPQASPQPPTPRGLLHANSVPSQLPDPDQQTQQLYAAAKLVAAQQQISTNGGLSGSVPPSPSASGLQQQGTAPSVQHSMTHSELLSQLSGPLPSGEHHVRCCKEVLRCVLLACCCFPTAPAAASTPSVPNRRHSGVVPAQLTSGCCPSCLGPTCTTYPA